MWDVILWFVIGGGIGWLARWAARTGSPGLVGDIVVGAAGALIANVTLALLIPGYFSFSQMNYPSMLVALIAAVVLIVIVRAVNGVFHLVRV